MQLTVKTKNRTFHGGIKADMMEFKDHLHYRELLALKRGAMGGKKRGIPYYMLNRLDKIAEPKKVKIGKIWPYFVEITFLASELTSDRQLALQRAKAKYEEVFGLSDDNALETIKNLYTEVWKRNRRDDRICRFYRKDMPKDCSKKVIEEVIDARERERLSINYVQRLSEWENIDISQYDSHITYDWWDNKIPLKITLTRKEEYEKEA